MRAVSNSIHSLHLWNADPELSVRPIATATVVDFRFDQKLKFMATTHCTLSASDVAAALERATPRTPWPKSLGIASYRDSASGCLVNASTSSRSSAVPITDSTSRRPVGNKSPSTNHFAISFESPYARIAVEKICDSVNGLLRVNAFSHR